MDVERIDFSPLKLKLPKSDAERMEELGKESKPKRILRGSIVLLFFIFFFPIVFIVFMIVGFTSQTFPKTSLAIFAALAAYVIWLINKRSREKSDAFHRFAKVNGWQIGKVAPKNPVLEGKGWRTSKSKASGMSGDYKFWFVEQHPPAVQTNSRLSSFETLMIETKKELPTTMIMPGFGAFAAFTKTVADEAFNLVPLSLEGNFDKSARVYCEAGKETETLEYITPDVMDAIVKDTKNVVIYAGKYVYISPTQTLIEDADVIRDIFRDAERLMKEIAEKQR